MKSIIKFGKNNFSTLLFRRNLTKIKSYIEVILGHNCEQDLNLDDLKRFLTLTKISEDYIERSVIDKIDIKEKIYNIINQNTDKQKNFELTRYLYNEYQMENNHYIFKSLFLNSFNSVREGDEDSTLLENFSYYSFNFKTVNPSIFLSSEYFMQKLLLITNDIKKDENYKGVNTSDIVPFLNIFPIININITEENFYKHHSDIININPIGESTISEYKMFNNLIDNFKFFINYKDLDKAMSFKTKLELKNRYKLYFKNKLDKYSDKTSFIDVRFDDILIILKTFIHDKEIQILSENIVNLKLNHDTCALDILLEYILLYIQHSKINKFILHFAAFNCMQHLKNKLTIEILEKDIILIYGFICENCHLFEGSETIKEFFAQFKSFMFHKRLIEDNDSNITNINFSNQAYYRIKEYHNAIKNSLYYDQTFDNFLTQSISINKQLTTIL